ncbi:MAG: phosphoadenosine phosphosulfate reductase family protein [Candidatus Cloacimonetes bacterium]|nr:phosphoadenosine phosphosulfate reductase family protein [Candidatus Cloacimonadota bacterium]
MGEKLYLQIDVLTAAKQRISWLFDEFKNIFVSVSSGKDSTALYNLAREEAIKRNRKINVFFLDQEAEYQGTVDIMREIMNHPNVIPHWYQVPIYMTNATSFDMDQLYAWGPGEEWMREKEGTAIKEIEGKYPERFYKFFEWFEKQQPEHTAFLVGLRGDESLNRHRAVSKNAGYKDIAWSTAINKGTSYKFYPIYDWGIGDVWKYINDNKFPYNSIYDKMYANNCNYYNTMRVSNLIHEKSFKCLTDLQVLEPETYEKVVKRIKGAHCAAIYAKKSHIYHADTLPEGMTSWKDYRDYLLETTPLTDEKRGRFTKRFSKQRGNEDIFKQQCTQILKNDWENNISVDQNKDEKRAKLLDKWRAIL